MPEIYTLITGASSGIGQGIAIRLSKERKILLHGRDALRLEETKKNCQNQEWHRIWSFDLNDPDGIEESLSKIMIESSITIDCFIHCAGIARIIPMRMSDYKFAHEMMNVNFFSAAEITRLLVKKKLNHLYLKNILFISSIASLLGSSGYGIYSASKGAINSLTRALAVEVAPQIRVNAILPGGIKTRGTQAFFDDPGLVEKMQKDYLLGPGTVEDIVDSAEFLLSDKARWITGQEWIVDGGRTSH